MTFNERDQLNHPSSIKRAKAEELAERIAEHHPARFLRQLAAKLNEVAEREGRQDRIEAKVKRRHVQVEH